MSKHRTENVLKSDVKNSAVQYDRL